MRKEPKPEDIALGERITRVRREFADNADQGRFAEPLNVTRQAVVNWERGHGAGRASLKRIATAYDVSFDWLATGIGEPRQKDGERPKNQSARPTKVHRAAEPNAVTARLGELFSDLLKSDEDIQIKAIRVLEQAIPARRHSRSTKTKAQ